jgi:two-component system chemotaxis response regulator CheY
MAKILIVDDSESARSEIESLLGAEGHECLTAVNGQEGFKLFEQHKDIVLVVTDLNMPVMNGIDMCTAIKKLDHGKVPVIVVSSDSIADLKEKGKQAGVFAWIVKPIDHANFMSGIKYVLEKEA